MTVPEPITENPAVRTPGLAETTEAPHSWDPAGRNVPATKLDWCERLPFQQVRGIAVAADPERSFPESGDPGGTPA